MGGRVACPGSGDESGTMTTLNGKKKIKTPTTVQATIPLTIT
jgi:hypothetical protein